MERNGWISIVVVAFGGLEAIFARFSIVFVAFDVFVGFGLAPGSEGTGLKGDRIGRHEINKNNKSNKNNRKTNKSNPTTNKTNKTQ